MTDKMQTEQSKVETNATLICPICETKQKVVMPIDKFQHYYKCTNEECAADLSPLNEKDCVFCSFADKPCPPRQQNPNINTPQLKSLI